jgi:hypothetical protein
MSTLFVNKILPDSGSNVVISGSLIVSQSLIVVEDISLSGSIRLGNAAGDSIGFIADVNSSIFPDADVTYNLGSTSKQWNELVIKSITASGNISASALSTITAGTGSFGVLNFKEFTNITASGNISASGYISGSTFIGDGSKLTGISVTNLTNLELTNITASQGLLITGGTGSFYGGVSASGTGSFDHVSASGNIESSGTGSFIHLVVAGMVSGNISSSGTGSFQGGIDCIGDGTSWAPTTGAFGYVSCSEDVSASGDVYGAIGYFNTLSYTSTSGVTLKSTLTADDKPVIFTLATGETDIAANDILGKINFQAPNEATGTDAVLVAAGIEAVSEGDFAANNNATKLSFKTAASETAAEKMSLSSVGLLTVTGRILTNNTTEATSTTDGSLQTDGGLSVAKSTVIGDDLDLLSDSAILSIGAGKDFTITHDGTTGAVLAGTPITINSTGDLTLDSSTDVIIDAAGGNVEFKDAGTLQLTLDMDTTGAAQILKLGVDGDELLLQQFDGIETARVLDGANLPSAAGTSTSIASGNTGQGGFGFRKMVYLLGSGNNDNVLTLTANQSGGVIFVTPTNNVGIVLPAGIPGIHYKVVIADKISRAFTIKTAGAGTDNNDTFFMHCTRVGGDGAQTSSDVDGDTLTFTNALEGSTIDLLCLQGGANEKWLAEVKSLDTVVATVADS